MQYDDFLEDKQVISVSQVFAVLFGRKKLFLILMASIFVFMTIILKFTVSDSSKSYTAKYFLSSQLAENCKYSDGTDIDYDKLISENSIKKIATECGLSEKKAEEIYASPKFNVTTTVLKKVIKEEEDEELNEEEDIVLIYKNFEVSVPAKSFSSVAQAKKFIEMVADLPNQYEISLSKTNYANNFALYNSAIRYDKKLDYLELQEEMLIEKYDALIEMYGNVQLADGSTLLDAKTRLTEFYDHNIAPLSKINLARGYVINYSNAKEIIAGTIEGLNVEKTNKTNRINELTDKVHGLLALANGVETLDIKEYNEEIFELSLEVSDINEEISKLTLMLSNIPRLDSDPAFLQEQQSFDAQVESNKTKLAEATNEFAANEEYVASNYSLTHFESSGVMKKTSTFGLPLVIVVSALLALIIPMCVNIVLDGKKLTSKYKLVHVSQIKE